MDIRDFKNINVPELRHEKGKLGTIYGLQRELLTHYTRIERLPEPPFDLDVKSHQIIIKDFIARIIEEIGEGYESLEKIVKGKDLTENVVLNHIQNFNEEMADATHFLMETIIVSAIDFEDFEKYLSERLTFRESVMVKSNGTSSDILEIFYLIAKRLNHNDTLINTSHPIINHQSLDDPFMKGGSRVCKEFLEEFSILAWEFTYKLSLARNSLKNKPWKQTEMTTDYAIYRKYLLDSFLAMIRLFEYSGISSNSLYNIYYRKNQVNLFRIKSKY